jgi:cell division protease FtsH
MVCEWGMSDELGPLTYGKKEEAIFLGKEFNRHQDYSEATALAIDAEVKKIVMAQHARARGVIEEHREKLAWVAEALLEHEALDAAQLQRVLAGERFVRETEPQPSAQAAGGARPAKRAEPTREDATLPSPMAAPKATA